MYRRGIVVRFLVIGLLFLGAMALFRAGTAHGYMMAAATGAEGLPIGPHFPGGHFRPVGFGPVLWVWADHGRVDDTRQRVPSPRLDASWPRPWLA
jgi:hypothetical protein